MDRNRPPKLLSSEKQPTRDMREIVERNQDPIEREKKRLQKLREENTKKQLQDWGL